MKMPDATPPSDPSLPVDPSTLWRALDHEMYVWVVAGDGVIRYVNEAGARFYLGKPVEEVVGRGLNDFFPETFTQERMQLMQMALETSRPAQFRTHWDGQILCGTAWPLYAPYEGVLVLVRHAFMQHPNGTPMLTLREDDGRLLAELSSTERLVLAGIGEGWSTAEVARRMHRSVKTVEWHRSALGQKLGCSNRVELARVALLAGLSWEQAVAMNGGESGE